MKNFVIRWLMGICGINFFLDTINFSASIVVIIGGLYALLYYLRRPKFVIGAIGHEVERKEWAEGSDLYEIYFKKDYFKKLSFRIKKLKEFNKKSDTIKFRV